jgi:hypothetical protein
MPRAVIFSVPPSGSRYRPALNHGLRRWLARELRRLRPAVAISTAACRGERYRKSFGAFAHTSLLLFHGLSGLPSLRQSYGAFAACERLVAVSGLGLGGASAPPGAWSGSFSQYAAANTSRPAAYLSGLLPALCARVRQLPRPLGPPRSGAKRGICPHKAAAGRGRNLRRRPLARALRRAQITGNLPPLAEARPPRIPLLDSSGPRQMGACRGQWSGLPQGECRRDEHRLLQPRH